MTLSVCMEKMEDRWIAYVNGLFGCYASDVSREKAFAALPQALKEYLDWCRWNGIAIAGVSVDEPLELEETVLEWSMPDGTAVNAFFAADSHPVSAAESSMAAALLEWTRADLLKSVEGLSQEIMDKPVVGAWNIGGIFFHTLRADRYYLSTLNLIPGWDEAPAQNGLPAVLEWTQAHYLSALPKLVGLNTIVQKDGETWSARKILRRAIWHRRDHTAHIYQFREALGV